MRVPRRFRFVAFLLAGAPLLSACGDAPEAARENVTISVDAEGNLYWNGELVTCEEMSERFDDVANGPSVIDFCDLSERISPPPE